MDTSLINNLLINNNNNTINTNNKPKQSTKRPNNKNPGVGYSRTKPQVVYVPMCEKCVNYKDGICQVFELPTVEVREDFTKCGLYGDYFEYFVD